MCDFATDTDTKKITEHQVAYYRKKCPYCNQTGRQIFISGIVLMGEYDYADGIVLTKCADCECVTVRYFEDEQDSNGWNEDERHNFYESSTIPSFNETDFSELIKTKYPNFVKIYSQSQEAEDQGLNLICGMGYRKALEFLITDYLIENKPDLEEKLKKPNVFLSKKINMLPEKMQNLARVMSWIGNDETHVIKQNDDLSIEDMKNFMASFVVYIEMQEQFNRAEQIAKRSKK